MVLNPKRSLSVLLLVLVALSMGCGGHSTKPGGSNTGGSTGPGGTQPGDTSMTPAAIHAVLDAADAQFSTIVNATADHDARNAQLVAWMKTRTEFADSGLLPSVDGVWGRLKNGHLFVATSEFVPGETRAATGDAPRVQPSPVPIRTAAHEVSIVPARTAVTRAETKPELPKAAQARVLLSLDKGFYDPPNDRIASMLRDRNYNVLQQTATLDNLKHVQGDGAFYWGTHGTIAWDARKKIAFWAAWSADDVTDAANAANQADLDDGTLVYFTAAYGLDGDQKRLKTHYAITAKFIEKYNWSLAKKAFVFMNCCHSDNGAIAIDIANRAEAYGSSFGWDNSVLVSSAWKAGEFAFDRLLGMNRYTPENYPERPFQADEVFFDMQRKGLDDGGGTCRLQCRSGASPSLAPSIQRMEVSERIRENPLGGKTKLTLYGIFGDDKGTVKVGGVDVPVTTWATDKVECQPADLPGPGFAGDVVATAGDRMSNSIPLTQWHGQVKYSIDLLPSIAADANATITCDVYFRGDVHYYRINTGASLVAPKPFDFRASQGSTARWVVNGNPPPMTVWTGPTSADLPFGLNGTVDIPYGTGYIFSGNLDYGESVVKTSFNYLGCFTSFAAPGGMSAGVSTLHDPDLISQGSSVGPDGYVVYANSVPMTIDEDSVIAAGSKTGSTPVLNPKLSWTTFVPSFTPVQSKGEDDVQR